MNDNTDVPEDGWHLMVDSKPAKQMREPMCARYWLSRFQNGKPVESTERWTGFTYAQDAREKIGKKLCAQLKALDRPLRVVRKKVEYPKVEVRKLDD